MDVNKMLLQERIKILSDLGDSLEQKTEVVSNSFATYN